MTPLFCAKVVQGKTPARAAVKVLMPADRRKTDQYEQSAPSNV